MLVHALAVSSATKRFRQIRFRVPVAGYTYSVDEASSWLSPAPGVTFEGVFQRPGSTRGGG